MKYTIELTDTEYNILTGFMNMINSEIQTYYFQNTELVPIKIRTTNLEDTNEHQIGYKVGFEDGKKQAIEEIPELANKENEIYNDGYNKGYNSAINDYNAMYEWLHDCFVDFEKFLLEKGFYTDEKFLDGFVVGQLMYDLICDHDMAEVISEFKVWQEEKKKADEESIKRGDEVKDLGSGNIGVVLAIGKLVVYITNNGVHTNTLGSLEKTGRHFEEVQQLLSKLQAN